MKRPLLAALLCLCLCGIQRPAFAHATSTSYLMLKVPDSAAPLEMRWDLSLQSIVWSVFIDQDYDGVVTWQEVQNARVHYIEPAVLAEIAVKRGGADCPVRVRILRWPITAASTIYPWR